MTPTRSRAVSQTVRRLRWCPGSSSSAHPWTDWTGHWAPSRTWPFAQQNVVGAGIQDFAQVDVCCNRRPVTPRSRLETYCMVTSGCSDTCSCVMCRLRRHSLIRRPICTLSGFFFLFSRMGSSMTILKALHEVRNKAVIVKSKCCSFIWMDGTRQREIAEMRRILRVSVPGTKLNHFVTRWSESSINNVPNMT